jgi:signal transduction histidine kinase
LFTGYANKHSPGIAQLGAFDYIPKPFTPKELREVVENALEKARKSGEGKMLDLMAIVAHELKSPVATVHSTVETLYGGYFGNLTPEQRDRLASVMRNCQYLEDIIRCYIDLSRWNSSTSSSSSTSGSRAGVGPVVRRQCGKPEGMRIVENTEVPWQPIPTS